jgi:hypothetical protein
MFTLFWSGKKFAPKLNVGEGGCRVENLGCIQRLINKKNNKSAEGEAKGGLGGLGGGGEGGKGYKTVTEPTNIQDFLQDCYIGALRALAKQLIGTWKNFPKFLPISADFRAIFCWFFGNFAKI